MALLAPDRRDEGLVQQPVDFGGHPVGRALGGIDLGRMPLAQHRVVIVVDQQHEGPRRLRDEGRMLVEELEEVALARQQFAEEHALVSPRYARLAFTAPRL
jgi:hypothetical protein